MTTPPTPILSVSVLNQNSPETAPSTPHGPNHRNTPCYLKNMSLPIKSPGSTPSPARKTTKATPSGPDLRSLLALLAQQNSKLNTHVNGAMSTVSSMRTVQSALVEEGKLNRGFQLCDEHFIELGDEIRLVYDDINDMDEVLTKMLDSMRSVVRGLVNVEEMFDPETYFRVKDSESEGSESEKEIGMKGMELKHGDAEFKGEVKAMCKDATEKRANEDVLTTEDGMKQKLDVEMRG